MNKISAIDTLKVHFMEIVTYLGSNEVTLILDM